ncbi:Mog1p/PsbP-like protein [Meredithblackwellia eburnea MCA 4105]
MCGVLASAGVGASYQHKMDRQLYGGAITAPIPLGYTDASTLRQVPDEQEVWIDNNSNTSIIIEVLQQPTATLTDDDDMATVHWQSLAHDNDAITQTILSTYTLPLTTTQKQQQQQEFKVEGPTIVIGHQTIAKFNANIPDTVLIQLAIWRIPQKNTDLVLSVNFPIKQANSNNDNSQSQEERDPSTAKKVFQDILNGLVIKDFGLFAG